MLLIHGMTSTAAMPRVGQWLNLFHGRRVVLQGYVAKRIGEQCLMDLFHPGDNRPFDRAWLNGLADGIEIYDTRAEMRAAAEPRRSHLARHCIQSVTPAHDDLGAISGAQ
jgi:hypothetical protein